jgi:maltodextrin utilization protein YvdJ
MNFIQEGWKKENRVAFILFLWICFVFIFGLGVAIYASLPFVISEYSK